MSAGVIFVDASSKSPPSLKKNKKERRKKSLHEVWVFRTQNSDGIYSDFESVTGTQRIRLQFVTEYIVIETKCFVDTAAE